MSEILDLLRILGLPKAVGLKRRYDTAQPVVRGYATTRCLWALITCGLADRLLEDADGIDVATFAAGNDLDRHVLESILTYLDGVSVVRLDGGRVRLLKRGRTLLEDTRGLFELIYAYAPLLANLEDMLAGRKAYGRDVDRRIEYVGRGSGRMCRDLPYPVMVDIIARHGCRHVLDLGCGDLALATFLCEQRDDVTVLGVDIDAEMVAYCRTLLEGHPLAARIDVVEGDLRDPATLGKAETRAEVDCITAVDTFHEYLGGGATEIVAALKALREAFPGALFVIGELCSQSREQLRKQPTGFLEHHLCHDLSNQTIGSPEQWRCIFAEAGFRIVEEKVFTLVGHGYFALR